MRRDLAEALEHAGSDPDVRVVVITGAGRAFSTGADVSRMRELMAGEEVEITGVGTAKAALEALQARRFDCAIVDLGLPDLPGAELIERMRSTKGGEELPSWSTPAWT